MALRAMLLALLVAACGDDPTSSPPPPPVVTEGWWNDRVFYEIFVRSFADSDGDGIGDLAGLTARLDELNDGDPATTDDLGVTGIWLMPIFASPSYHGYDVTDYRAVNPEYGTLADLDALVDAAHARGIKVILDFVANHTSSQHPWFLDSRSSTTSQRRGWYEWRSSNPGWTQPWGSGVPTWHWEPAFDTGYFYGVFWEGMPDLDFQNPDVEAQVLSDMDFWLDRGVDGFRLDAARYLLETDDGQADLPGTHALLKRMRTALSAEHPDVLLVGEVWTAATTVATYWGGGDELHLAFAFDQAQAVQQALNTGDAAPLYTAILVASAALAGKDRNFDAPFLTNHDQLRVARALGSPGAKARAAAAVLFALPGTPFVYYGEELGMRGGTCLDECKRTPYRWDASVPGHGFTSGAPWFDVAEADGVDLESQRGDDASLWSLYRRLIALRQSEPSLAKGEVAQPAVSGSTGILALLRTRDAERVLFVVNVGSAASGPFQVNVSGTPSVLLSEGLTATPTSGAALGFPGAEPHGFAYYSLN